MSKARQNFTYDSWFMISSLTKQYLILMWQLLLLLDSLQLFYNLMALWLSWYIMLSWISYPWSFSKYRVQITCVRTFLTLKRSTSVELLVFHFIAWLNIFPAGYHCHKATIATPDNLVHRKWYIIIPFYISRLVYWKYQWYSNGDLYVLHDPFQFL